MAASESSKLLSSDPEKHGIGPQGASKFKKTLALFAVVGVVSVGLFVSVAGIGGTQNAKTNVAKPLEAPTNDGIPVLKSSNSENTKQCQLPPEKLTEIKNLQGNIDQIINYVLNGSGKGSTWNRLAEFVDTFGARFSGTQVLEDSIDYMLDFLAKDGLENVHGEEAMVPKWVRGNESAVMVEPRVEQLIMLGLGSSVGTPPEGIAAEVVVVRSFQELSEKSDQEIQGKIVVFNQNYEGYGRGTKYRRNGASEAAKRGAVATLIRSVTPYSISSAHTGWQDYEENVKKIPTACITVENSELLQRLTDRGKKVVIKLKMDAKTYPDVKSRNVVAEIKGSKYPEQVVIVSGHIDSWDVGHGAQDDGGGALISTQALSVIHALGLRPKRTLRVVLWTSEEPGTQGAMSYAGDHKDETQNWSLIMESDMGTFKPNGIVFSGQNEQSQCIMEEIMNFLKPINAARLTLSQSSGPDIQQWTKTGIPGAILDSNNGNYFNYHHTNADTMTHVDKKEMDLCAIVWTVVSYAVAELEEMLPR